MTKEIGGYMELEHFRGREMYGELFKFNLGRTAFVWLLRNIEHDRVFIPEYICNSVPDSAEAAGFKVVRYGLDENLLPVWGTEGAPGPDDILYLVSFYGQLTEDEIRACHAKHPKLIVDNAQAFYDAPLSLEGVHTIYTPRKYFGLSDGAYVAGSFPEGSAAPADYLSLERDRSGGRISHLTGRLEGNARDHYSEMLAASEEFGSAEPKRMSLLTENFLRAIDYDCVQQKRCANYRLLSELLPDSMPGGNPFVKRMPSAPFAYPYYHENGVALRKYLAERNIFVPTNWSYLIKKLPEGSLEHEWSANILPLPVDQRYGEDEMHIIADAVHSYSA